MKTQSYKVKGFVTSITKNAYLVTVKELDKPMLCYLSGKMMRSKIKAVEGDEVEVEFDQTDATKGRIIRRR